MIIFIWVVALFLFALWSLFGWGLHALVSWQGNWTVDLDPWLRQMPFADLLERWFPTWQDWVRLSLDLMHAGLSWLGSAAPTIVTVVWAIGALVLLGAGGLLTLIVVLIQRKTPPTPTPA